MKNVIMVFVVACLTFGGEAQAGIWDGLKTIGKGVADVAGSVAEGAVNTATSAVDVASSFVDANVTNIVPALTLASPISPTGSGTNSSAGVQSGTKSDSPAGVMTAKNAKSVSSSDMNRPVNATELRAFVDKCVKPRLKVFKNALERRQFAYSGTPWNDGLFSDRAPDELKEVVIPRLFEKGIAVCFDDDSYYNLHGTDDEERGRLKKWFLKPWSRSWIGKNKYSYNLCCFEERGNGKCKVERLYNPITGEENYNGPFDDRALGVWKSQIARWLDNEDQMLRHMMLIDGEGTNLFAKVHGETYVPFRAYKDLVLGSSVEDAYDALKSIDSGFRWGKPYSEEGTGKVCGEYLRGKVFMAYLERHILSLIFGAFEEDQGSMLVSVKMSFRGSEPKEESIIEKYKKMEGAVVRKVKKELSRTWRDGETGTYCKNLAEGLAALAEKEPDDAARKRLEEDAKTIKNTFSTCVVKEVNIVDVNGVEIEIQCDDNSSKVRNVVITDRVVADKMKANLEAVVKARRELNAKMKSANKEKAEAAAVDF